MDLPPDIVFEEGEKEAHLEKIKETTEGEPTERKKVRSDQLKSNNRDTAAKKRSSNNGPVIPETATQNTEKKTERGPARSNSNEVVPPITIKPVLNVASENEAEAPPRQAPPLNATLGPVETSPGAALRGIPPAPPARQRRPA